MSLLRSLVGIAAPIAGAVLGGPAGFAIGSAIGGAVQRPTPSPVSVMPAASMQALPTLGALPQIGRAAGAGVMALGGVAVAGARSAMRGAITLCRRHPQWCSTIGGTAAVAAMIESGQLPAPRRRRGRGLSSRDLRSYRRVHNLLAGFCTPKARIRKSC